MTLFTWSEVPASQAFMRGDLEAGFQMFVDTYRKCVLCQQDVRPRCMRAPYSCSSGRQRTMCVEHTARSATLARGQRTSLQWCKAGCRFAGYEPGGHGNQLAAGREREGAKQQPGMVPGFYQLGFE